MSLGTYRYVHGAATGNFAVTSGNATLHALSVGTGAASAVITVYDGTSASGIVVGVFSGVTVVNHVLDSYCPNGIFIVVSGGNCDFTVTYH